MKRGVAITGIILAVLLATAGCNHVHRGIRDTIDHARMRRYYRSMEYAHPGMMGRGNTGPEGRFMYHGHGYRMYGNNWQANMPGARGRMGMYQGNRESWGKRPMAYANQGFGVRRINRIPNLTDKQRQEIADLRQQQMAEMDKIREESFAKMQTIREENRSKIMNILTDDQKKFLESGPQ